MGKTPPGPGHSSGAGSPGRPGASFAPPARAVSIVPAQTPVAPAPIPGLRQTNRSSPKPPHCMAGQAARASS